MYVLAHEYMNEYLFGIALLFSSLWILKNNFKKCKNMIFLFVFSQSTDMLMQDIPKLVVLESNG